jgi:hypothetical protein
MQFLYKDFLPDRHRAQLNINTKPNEEEMGFFLELAKTNYLIENIDLVYVRKFLETYAMYVLSHLMFNVVNSTCMFFLMDHFMRF